MRTIFLNIILIVVFNLASGQQNTDSLLIKLPELSGRERAEALAQLSLEYSQADSSQSFSFANEVFSLAESFGDTALMGTAFFNKAECFYYFNDYDAALKNYQTGLDFFLQVKDSVDIGETLNSIGLVYYFKGDYNLAVKQFFKSLSYLQRVEFTENTAHVYSNLGMVFSRIGEFQKAIENYQYAAILNGNINDLNSLAVNFNGVGVAFYNQEKYDSSLVYYHRALNLFRQLDNRQREAIALNNIANIYVNRGDSLELALHSYQQAAHVFDELGDLRSKAFVLEGLGSVHRELGNYNKAIHAFHESLELIKANGYGYYLQQLNYHDLSLTYERMGRTENAFDAFKLYSEFKDSLLQEERINQVTELEKKYKTQQKEAEIGRLNSSHQIDQLQIKRDEELRAFGIITILLLVAAIFLVSIAYLNKNRVNELLNRKNNKIEDQRKELEKLNASKNKFFSIIAHDLKNPFHTVMGYSYLMNKEYERFSDEEKKKYAADIYRSANSIFRLLQNLLDWSRSQTGSLRCTPQELNFRDIYESIENLLRPIAEQKEIRLIAEMPDETNVYADPMMLETILRNLMNNAIKFTNVQGWVKTIVKNDDRMLTVCVEDNGVGMQSDDLVNLFRIDSKVKKKGTNQEDGSGLGLIICNEFIQKNGGSIWVDSESGQGSRFYFTIPRT